MLRFGNLARHARQLKQTTQLRQYTFHVGCSWSSKPRLASEESFKKQSAYDDKHEVAQWRSQMMGDRLNVIGDAGEDFWFIEPHKDESGIALGIADGVGGWFSAKVDPSKFSQTLMWAAAKKAGGMNASEAVPMDLIDAGHKGVLGMEDVKAGSSTACVVTLDAHSGLLKGANLGDSTFVLIRDAQVIESTKQQTHFFNCPFQLSKLRKGIDKNHITDYAHSSDVFETRLQEGDCVLLFTDGLGDNVFLNEIIQLKQAVEDHMPNAHMTEKSQAFADTLVSYAKICMEDEFKVSPIELSARQEKIKGFIGGKVDEWVVKGSKSQPLTRGGSEPSKNRFKQSTPSPSPSTSSFEPSAGSGESTYIAMVSSRLLDGVNKVFMSSSTSLSGPADGVSYKNRRSPKKANVYSLANQIVQELEVAKTDVYLLRAVARQVHRYLSVFSSQLDPLLAMVCADPSFISVCNPNHSPTQSQSDTLNNPSTRRTPSPPPPTPLPIPSSQQQINNAQHFAFELAHTAWIIKNTILDAFEEGKIPQLAKDLIKDSLEKLDGHVVRVVNPTIKALRSYLGLLASGLRESYPDANTITRKNGNIEFNPLPYHLKALSKGMDASKKILVKMTGPCQPESEAWVARITVHLIWSAMLAFSVKKPATPQLNGKQVRKATTAPSTDSTATTKTKNASPTPIHSALGRVAAVSKPRTPSPDAVSIAESGDQGNCVIVAEMEAFVKMIDKFTDGLVQVSDVEPEDELEPESVALARSALKESIESLKTMKEFTATLSTPPDKTDVPVELPKVLALHLLIARKTGTPNTPDKIWKWSWDAYAEGIGGFGGAIRWQSAVFKVVEAALKHEEKREEDKEWNKLILDLILSIPPLNEFRLELDVNEELSIRLVEGRAELNGCELSLEKSLALKDELKCSIYTWTGCKLEITGQSLVEYTSNETPLITYLNLHLAFEQQRIKARNTQSDFKPSPEKPNERLPGYVNAVDASSSGYRVMVIGQEDSGKSTLSKTLLNYAARTGKGWTPIFVNLDPSDGGPLPPGTLSATAYSTSTQTTSPVNAFGSCSTSGAALDNSAALIPQALPYAHASPARNPKVYKILLEALARRLDMRLERDAKARSSGVFIDTPAAFTSANIGSDDKNSKYDLIKHALHAFRVDVLLVIGHEKLYIEMQRLLKSLDANIAQNIKILKVPKSGGAVETDDAYRSRIQAAQIKSFFYGNMSNISDEQLSPQSMTIKIDNLKVFKITEDKVAPSSALPIGASRVLENTQLERVNFESSSQLLTLVHSLLYLVKWPDSNNVLNKHAKEFEGDIDSKDLIRADLVGFLIVTAIDSVKRTITVLAPSPGRLPSLNAVFGSFEWQDT
ncbi:hypothetical protein E3P92_01973 [Wallemia ichthyophaga]|nr:hypothetical protein E3P91_01713 [Wallemia ichthyophaga]TIA82040.1 hypothetical protein E3P98_01627 [Wallemia ichthyophaga]TIB14514.1 hypothetical protein E3P92_01973 [Wallemia ichthyophaga]TIB63651.1 hypothetical protein E3P78_01640 [Wallemia ichthyophaga]